MPYRLENQIYAARIAGAFAHELCNPLQGVRSLIETITRETNHAAGVQRKLEQVEAGMDRLAGVLDAIRTTYENLPRPVDQVTIGGLTEQMIQALERCGADVVMENRIPEDAIVFALAPELATLVAHALLDPAARPVSVNLHTLRTDDFVLIDCTLVDGTEHSSPRQEYRPLNGHAGLPVLIDELSRQCEGEALFRYDDFGLHSVRIKLPTQI